MPSISKKKRGKEMTPKGEAALVEGEEQRREAPLLKASCREQRRDGVKTTTPQICCKQRSTSASEARTRMMRPHPNTQTHDLPFTKSLSPKLLKYDPTKLVKESGEFAHEYVNKEAFKYRWGFILA
ncbi:hypothetical protein GJ744_007687 [Endocarpon pusillum]|uniref:Uncharacterized protein n=1 Tax=Endocarpon pusillum TaxID=364733 RepID=A0A8H7E3Z8_9EURO|nr:hypothetical protein GJ744_007687 [Endocarpon pusillum]